MIYHCYYPIIIMPFSLVTKVHFPVLQFSPIHPRQRGLKTQGRGRVPHQTQPLEMSMCRSELLSLQMYHWIHLEGQYRSCRRQMMKAVYFPREYTSCSCMASNNPSSDLSSQELRVRDGYKALPAYYTLLLSCIAVYVCYSNHPKETYSQ